MKTISEHNNQIYKQIIQDHKAGVLCDYCNVEMFYLQPNMVLASIPPKMTVQCPKCGNTDYKIK